MVEVNLYDADVGGWVFHTWPFGIDVLAEPPTVGRKETS